MLSIQLTADQKFRIRTTPTQFRFSLTNRSSLPFDENVVVAHVKIRSGAFQIIRTRVRQGESLNLEVTREDVHLAVDDEVQVIIKADNSGFRGTAEINQ